MSEDPVRYCTICMGAPGCVAKGLQPVAVNIVSVFDNGEYGRPSQFFVCGEHSNRDAALTWLERPTVNARVQHRVLFEPLAAFFEKVRELVLAEDSLNRLDTLEKDT